MQTKRRTRGWLVVALLASALVWLGSPASGATNCDPEFEEGPDGICWTQSVQPSGRELITSGSPKAGSFSAELCGVDSCADRLSQVVDIPMDTEQVVITYWVKGTQVDPEEDCGDQLRIGLVDPDVPQWIDGDVYCDALVPDTFQAYTFYPDHSLFLGGTATFAIDAVTDGAAATRWYVDDVTIEVRNEIVPQYVLSVTKAGSGSGKVTSDPSGIDCGGSCSAPYDSGTEVSLTAEPYDGSVFTGWSGACSGTGTCTVTMDDARSVTAAFAATDGGGDGGDGGGSVSEHARTVSLSLAKHLKASGSVSAGGYAPCQNNASVKIQRKVSGVFKTIKTVGTGSDNKYAVRIPDRKGVYRAQVVAKSPNATHECMGDISPIRRHAHER